MRVKRAKGEVEKRSHWQWGHHIGITPLVAELRMDCRRCGTLIGKLLQ